MKIVISSFVAVMSLAAVHCVFAATVFDFSSTDGFDIVNYQNNLLIGTQDCDGERAMVFRNNQEKFCDTYWALTTPLFPVRSGKTFAVKVRTKSDISLLTTRPVTAVLWHAKDGKDSTFLGRFITAALTQKRMVTEEISAAGIKLAGKWR